MWLGQGLGRMGEGYSSGQAGEGDVLELSRDYILVLLLSSCVTLGKPPNPPQSFFPHL